VVLLGERLLSGMQLHPAKSWFFGSKKEALCNNSKICTQLLSNQVVNFWGKLKLLFGVRD
jgi:hypothetical protein